MHGCAVHVHLCLSMCSCVYDACRSQRVKSGVSYHSPLYFLYAFIYLYVCICIMVCSRRSKNSFWKLILSFYHISPRNWAQVVRVGHRHLYLLSQLTGLPYFLSQGLSLNLEFPDWPSLAGQQVPRSFSLYLHWAMLPNTWHRPQLFLWVLGIQAQASKSA